MSTSDETKSEYEMPPPVGVDCADSSSDEEILPASTSTMRKRQKNTTLVTSAPMPSAPVPSLPIGAHHLGHENSQMLGAGYVGPWSWMQPPWMRPPPMHPESWQSGGRPPFQSPWLGSVHVEDRPLVESVDRASRRRKREQYDIVASHRDRAGKKPHELNVKAGGEIDTCSEGKNAWDAVVRTYVPRILDMSVVDWESQKPAAVALLREKLDAEFEYVGHTLNTQGFKNAIKKYLKAERSRLKSRFVAGCEDCPVHIDPTQWLNLKTYWDTSPQVAKTQKMVNARAQVKDYSNVGRKGRAGKEALVREGKDRSPSLTEIAEGIRESQGVSTIAVGATAAMKARVLALENKHTVMQEKMTQILENQSESSESLKQVKNMLQKCMERFLGNDKDSHGLSISAVETQLEIPSKQMQATVGQLSTTFQKDVSLVSSETHEASSDSDDLKEVPPSTKVKGSTPSLQDQAVEIAVSKDAVKNDIVLTTTPSAAAALVEIGDSSPILKETTLEPTEVAMQDHTLQVETKKRTTRKVLASAQVIEEMLDKGDKATMQNSSATDSGKGKCKGRLVKKTVSTSHEEPITNLKTTAVTGVVQSSKARTNQLRSSPRKQKVQPSCSQEVTTIQEEDALKKTSGKRETRTKAPPIKKASTEKFVMGQEVSLLNPKNVKQAVASGTISGIGGVHNFHFVTIPESWYKVDVKEAIWPHVQLMRPNLFAEQSKVKDVVGSNAIWEGKFLKLAT